MLRTTIKTEGYSASKFCLSQCPQNARRNAWFIQSPDASRQFTDKNFETVEQMLLSPWRVSVARTVRNRCFSQKDKKFESSVAWIWIEAPNKSLKTHPFDCRSWGTLLSKSPTIFNLIFNNLPVIRFSVMFFKKHPIKTVTNTASSNWKP